MANRFQSFLQRVAGIEKPRAKEVKKPTADLIAFDNVNYVSPFGMDISKTEQLKRYRGWVYSAVSKIAPEVSNITLTLNKKLSNGDIEEVHQHPALDLLDFVNPFMTYYDLVETTITYQELTGNAYWWLVKDGSGNIVEIYPWLRPDRVKVIPSKDTFISGYKYQVPGTSEFVNFEPDEMIHFKYMNPNNPYYGFSPVQAAAFPIGTDERSEKWNMNFYDNSARPDGIIAFEDGLTANQAEQVRAQWENMHKASDNHGHRIGVISRGKYQAVGFSQKDMDFLEQRKFSRDEILAIFKVPKALLDPQEVNYASAQVAKKVFVEEVIVPKMQKFVNMLNEFLLPHFGGDDLFFDFVTPMEEDEELKLKRYEVLTKIGAMSPNEIRAEQGMEPIDGGDEIRTPNNTTQNTLGFTPRTTKKKKYNIRVRSRSTTAEMIGRIKEALVETAASKKKQSVSQKPPEEKSKFDRYGQAYWNNKIAKTDKDELKMREMLVKEFERQEKELRLVRKTVDVSFSVDEEAKIFAEVFLPFFQDLVEKYGEEGLRMIGLTGFDVTNDVQQHLKTVTGEFAKDVNITTEKKIRAALAQGIEDGEGVPELRKRIQNVFQSAKAGRATAITRTEVSKSSNYAVLEGWKQSGVVRAKKWFTAEDERVDPICAALHGKEFTLETDISTGDELFGNIQEPPAHVQCRCVLIPITKSKGEQLQEQRLLTDELEKTIAELKERGDLTEKEIKERTTEAAQEIIKMRERVEQAIDNEEQSDDSKPTA